MLRLYVELKNRLKSTTTPALIGGRSFIRVIRGIRLAFLAFNLIHVSNLPSKSIVKKL